MDEALVVTKRYGNEQLDIREFIRPDTYMVRTLVARLPADPDAFYRWVVANIAYPFGDDATLDLHQECRYLRPDGQWRVCEQTDDFWNLPSETLADRVGDCDDKSFLLVSMLRHLLGPDQVFATVGYWNGFGHVWVTVRTEAGWRVYETTLDQAPSPVPFVSEQPPYVPILRFNDVQVLREAPGAVPLRVRDPEKTHLIRLAHRAWI